MAGIIFILGTMAWGINAASSPTENGQDSYRPLKKGLTLKEIAGSKLHHGRARFLNPWIIPNSRSMFDIVIWKAFTTNDYKHLYKNDIITPVAIDWKPVMNHDGLSVTFITHSTLLIKDSGINILVDPVLNGIMWPYIDYSPLSPETITSMPKPDYVLITHSHYDHLDIESLHQFKDTALFLTPLGFGKIMQDEGIQKHRELDWLDDYSDGARKFTLLPCNHWSHRNPMNAPNISLWGSYLIRTASGKVIYISGDTAAFDRFDEIGGMADIDLAIFNVGAYEPRWFMKYAHMNPAETVKAFKELRAKQLMVVHWGTFRLGDEPVYLPPVDMKEEMARQGLSDRLIDIKHGQTLYFP